jgi:hypothetical protein
MQPTDAAHAPGWDGTDAMYCAALARGLRPVLVLDTVPWWATNDSDQCPQSPFAEAPTKCFMPPAPDHVDDLRYFAKQVAYRYPDAAAIEAWNEPNADVYWIQPADRAAQPRAQTYADLVLDPIYTGVKSGAPDTPVLAAGLAPLTAETAEDDGIPIDKFLDGMLNAGAARHMDALSLHPYAPWRVKAYDTVMALIDAVLAKHPEVPHPHLWLTEVGSQFDPLGGGANQSRVLQAVYARATARADVDAVLFHTLLNTSTHQPDEGYGWVRNVAGLLFMPRRVYCDFAAMLATPVNCGLAL